MKAIETIFPRVGKPCWPGLFLLSLTVLGAGIAPTIGIQAGRFRGTAGPAVGGVSIEPRSLRLTDGSYKEGEIVSGRFSIVNSLDRPVTINAIQTSCSCMAVLPEAGARIPFEIAPRGGAEFWVKGGVRAGTELEQGYQIRVEASCGGVALPDCSAELTFRVEDTLKARPQEIKVGEAPPGVPIHRKIYLYTVNEFKAGAPPSVRVSGTRAIKASIAAVDREAPDAMLRDFKVQYVIDMILEPDREEGTSGAIEVLSGGKTLLTIPVECTPKQEYRISASHLDVEGEPGRHVVRELYFESSSPAWQDLSVSSRLEGTTAIVERFDATTKVVRLQIQIPPAGQVKQGTIVLEASGKSRSVRIPVRAASKQR